MHQGKLCHALGVVLTLALLCRVADLVMWHMSYTGRKSASYIDPFEFNVTFNTLTKVTEGIDHCSAYYQGKILKGKATVVSVVHDISNHRNILILQSSSLN